LANNASGEAARSDEGKRVQADAPGGIRLCGSKGYGWQPGK